MTSIAYVTTTFPTMATFIENEVQRFVDRGVRVQVFTLGPVGDACQPEHEGLKALTRAIGSPLAPAAWAALLMWLLRKPHVVLGIVPRMVWASRQSPYALAGHLGYLPAAALLARIVEREGFDLVHGAWAHFPASVALLAARLTNRRFTMAAHAGADLYRTQAFLGEKVRAAESVAACVEGNARMLRDLAGDGARVHHIYHGVDRRKFDARERKRDALPMVITVGRLARAKGFDLAVRALAAMPATRRPMLVLVGDGPEREALEALAASLGVRDRLDFRGTLNQQQILPLYRRAWMLLAPSRVLSNGRRDGIPNVVVEAMAMGVPCVGTRAAGLEEAIEPGVTGWLVEPEDAEGMADIIGRMIEDPATLDRLGEAARARVADRFDAAANFERVAQLMNGVRRA